MKSGIINHLFGCLGGGFLCLVLLIPVSCSKHAAPEALSLDQVPSAMDNAFKKVQPDTREQVQSITTSVQNKDYAKAYLELQNLCSQPNLTAEQRQVATRSMLAVNAQLQS